MVFSHRGQYILEIDSMMSAHLCEYSKNKQKTIKHFKRENLYFVDLSQ